MSIIATVGRRSVGALTLIGSMYLLLTVGGISMVYPFLLMLSTATTTPSDMQEYQVIPRYYYNDNALYRKYLWLRYDTGLAGASAKDYNRAYPGAKVSTFRLDEDFGYNGSASRVQDAQAIPPGIVPDDPDVVQRADDLDRFLRESAILWPGQPLTETVTREENGKTITETRLVTDPYGQPLDPTGLTTGLGNRYRTVGYIGALYVGFSGVGRDQWTAFVEQFYKNPELGDEDNVARLKRLIEWHGRPYEQWNQVRPGYDIPTMPSWGIVEGERLQSDWLFYKAVWLSGAPVVGEQGAGPAVPGVSQFRARTLGVDKTESYTDVRGRTWQWTPPRAMRALRPTQIMPDFSKDLENRYMHIDQFNLAIGLARMDWAHTTAGRAKILPTGRDVVLAKPVTFGQGDSAAQAPETGLLAAARALLGVGRSKAEREQADPADYHYLLPPRIDAQWSKLTYVAGLNADRLAQLNERIEDAWLAGLRARGYRVVHLAPFESFQQIYLSARRPIYEPLAVEWDQFVAGKVPSQMIEPLPADQGGPAVAVASVAELNRRQIHLRLPGHAWRDFLSWLYAERDEPFRRLYLAGQDGEQVARRVDAGRMLYGPEYDQFSLAAMPVADRDVREFYAHKGELRRHFMFGNFAVVFDELVLEGRAMFNTIVLIFLAIATHITVNPLAAYALSRFRLTYTYKVLLFMLATMAFPPAVGMIPGFLLLKNFGLINTYAALVLPGIASGYTIFLLKGFFDALPQELYEAAEIDGAGKVTTFLNVTFPLSKPIFAIITLNSFTAAYAGFMWAFLICPDQKMWTVMVHLFNIQQGATPPLAMAALVIAAIPTFLVFLFCQNVILRGIIIPSFK